MPRHHRGPVGRCRVCRRRVYWVTLPSGKRVALDLDPAADGDTLVIPIGTGPGVIRLGITLRDEELREDVVRLGHELRLIHFKSSPRCSPDYVEPRERADLA